MRKVAFFIGLILLIGCAKVALETKKPLKVDINMRLDVYQHVVKEAESIEDQIYGDNEYQMNFFFGIASVYAADNMQEAIQRRKKRASKIEYYFDRNYIGENRKGFLVVFEEKVPSNIERDIHTLIREENRDRRIIYRKTADKNNISVDEAKKIFFQDHYDRAPSGWYFEIYNKAKNRYTWIKK